MADHNGSKYAPRPGNIPGVVVNFGGHDIVVAALGLAWARKMQESAATSQTDTEREEVGMQAILASINRNYPDFTREDLDALCDIRSIQEATQAILSQSGLKVVKPGELKPGSQ